MRQIKRAARNTSLITSASLLVIVLGAGYLLFGQSTPNTGRLNALENRIDAVEQRAPSDTGIQPSFMGKKVAELQQQIGDIQAVMGLSVNDLANLARNVATGSGASLSQRLASLEQQLSNGAVGAAQGSAPNLTGMVDRMQGMAQTPQGRAEMQQAVDELRQIVTGLQGRSDNLEQALNQAKTDSAALGQTLQDVNGRDLGAAAMLLALTQLRQSADRETPFTEDLALLRDVAQRTDPQLAESVEKLAPFAESGVLSPAGLKRELLASANDIVTAKMRGENVSVKEKVMARVQGLFSVSKNGMPVAGSAEQAMIEKASAQLDKGDVAGAMAILKQLDGPAANAAQPWQTKAAATIVAQQLDTQLVSSLMQKIKTGFAASGGAQPINLTPTQQPQTVQPAPSPEMAAPQPQPQPLAEPTMTMPQ